MPTIMTIKLEPVGLDITTFVVGNTFDAEANAPASESFLNSFGVTFGDGGSNLYVFRTGDSEIVQWTLTTPWDITTATAPFVGVDVSAQVSSPRAMQFREDTGTSLFVVGPNSTGIREYTLTTPWDTSTATYTGTFINDATLSSSGFFIKSDGTEVYISDSNGSGSNEIRQYTLSTPWDGSSASLTHTFSTSAAGASNDIADITVTSDGKNMLVSEGFDGFISQYKLGTAWDLSTATFFGNNTTAFAGDNVWGLYLRNNSEIFAVDRSNDLVTQLVPA